MKIARFSNIGFLLAAMGSAVGLGNIWKFPYITGEHGGGAFVLVYLITVIFIGLPVLVAELSIGRLARNDSVSSFEELSNNKKWKYAGFMAFNGVFTLVYYLVVIGWIVDYVKRAFFELPNSVEVAEHQFMQFVGFDLTFQFTFFILSSILTIYIVSKGIKSGIEKLNIYLMPSLIIIILGLFLYSTQLDSFSKSFSFMFDFNWEKLNSTSVIVAVGHAFFTLSLAMGAMLTYASSMPNESNLFKSAIYIVIVDTLIALLAGLFIFTFLFEFNAPPAKGPGLVFISLPSIFGQFGFLGHIFALLFFLALLFAGLTSAVSLLEPAVQYFINRFYLSRLKASILAGMMFIIPGCLALLSNTIDFGVYLTFFGKTFFDWFDFITSAFLLPIGGILMALFVGFAIDRDRLRKLFPDLNDIFFNSWIFVLRYIVPIGMSLVIGYEIF